MKSDCQIGCRVVERLPALKLPAITDLPRSTSRLPTVKLQVDFLEHIAPKRVALRAAAGLNSSGPQVQPSRPQLRAWPSPEDKKSTPGVCLGEKYPRGLSAPGGVAGVVEAKGTSGLVRQSRARKGAQPGIPMPGVRLENEKGEPIFCVREEIGVGYVGKNLRKHKGKLKTYPYGSLFHPPSRGPILRQNHLERHFVDVNVQQIRVKLKLATRDIDQVFLEASQTCRTVIPFVDSYSWLALGSFGREEMCPYSDLEFGVVYCVKPNALVDHGVIQDKFRRLSLKIAREMGVRARCVFIDVDGNVPFGKGGGALMNTPEALVQSIVIHSETEALDARHTMLMDARYLAGVDSSPEPFERFQACKEQVMNSQKSVKQRDLNSAHIGRLALNALKASLADLGREDLRYVNIKKHFRQPLDWAILSLCIKNGEFTSRGYLKRIESLNCCGVIDDDLARSLLRLYSMIFVTRAKLHSHHHEEEDRVLWNPGVDDRQVVFPEESKNKPWIQEFRESAAFSRFVSVVEARVATTDFHEADNGKPKLSRKQRVDSVVRPFLLNEIADLFIALAPKLLSCLR